MRIRLVPVVLLAVLAACTGGRSLPAPEVTRIPGLSFDETQMRSQVADGAATLSVPLVATAHVQGRLTLTLVDLAGKQDAPVGSRSVDLDLDHETRTVALRVPGLDPSITGAALGRYLVRYEVSTAAGRIHGARDLYVTLPRADLELLAPAELPAGASTYARAFVRDPATGAPLEGATVEVRYTPTDGTAVALGQGTTAADGSVVIPLAAPANPSAGTLFATATAGGLTADLTRDAKVTHAEAVLLTTDKPRYQPGQTMHLRALCLSRIDHAPAAGADVTFEAIDAKGNKVFHQVVKADDYGIAATRLPLASQVNFGAWRVKVGAEGGSAVRQVTVARYSLPKFQVKLTTGKDHYAPGDTVTGTVHAQYFFGREVAGQVTVEADVDGNALATTTGTLTGGSLDFTFGLPPSLAAGGAQDQVTVAAKVTDTASQEVDAQRTLPVASGDLLVSAVTDGTGVVGLPAQVLVAVSDPTGHPVAATVTALGLGTVKVGASGLGAIPFIGTLGAKDLDLKATAPDGRTGTTHLTLTAGARTGLSLSADHTVYAAGDTAHLDLQATPGAPSHLALDVASGGRVVSTRDVVLHSGLATVDLPIPADLSGALVVEASAASSAGRVLHASRTIFVDAHRQLAVKVSAPSTLAPGQSGALDIQVDDASGQGVPAAVGVSVVDPAVFALGAGAPGHDAADLAFAGEVPAPVAGHAAREILGGSGADRQAAARFLFAAAGPHPAWGIDGDSWRDALPKLKDQVQPAFDRDVAALRAVMVSEVKAGSLTAQNAPSVVIQAARGMGDAFGQPLTASADQTRFSVHLVSAGPDEVRGTGDDLSTDLDLYQLLSDGGYYDQGGIWGGFGAPAMGGAAGGTADTGAAAPGTNGPAPATPAMHVRSYFPETLLFQPAVITDPSGHATVPVTAADSITDWKVAATASTLDGRVGDGSGNLDVFQRFFVDVTLPPAITRGDQLQVPVAVYNYTQDPQSVTVTAQPASWYTLVSAPSQTVDLGPGEVKGTTFTVQASGVGTHTFSVAADGASLHDAVSRTLLVQPGGQEVDQGQSGTLKPGTVSTTVTFPADAIPGSDHLAFKVYPGVMAQTVEGIDAVVKQPHGCFEQSTSSTWPDVMVARYYQATGSGTAEMRKQVLDDIQAGYELLVSYQSPQGGFNWWGDDTPGNKILTALGIRILHDMDGLIDIDQGIVTKNADWLAAQQQADGSWPKGDALHMGDEFLSEDPAIVTAFAVEALAVAGGHDSVVAHGEQYLASRVRAGIQAPFTLAIVSRALTEAGSSEAAAALSTLDGEATVDAQGRYTWKAPDLHSWTGATGDSAGLETTAVAAQAFIRAGAYPDAAGGALAYLVAHKNALGVWGQTQSTVQALRAFTESVTGAGKPDVNATLTVTVDGQSAGTITVTPQDSDVVRTLDLSSFATTGAHQVAATMQGTGKLMYQVTGVHHLDWAGGKTAGGVGVAVTHGQTQLAVGGTDLVDVAVANANTGNLDQVLVQVGLAPGMQPVTSTLDSLVAQRLISRWEQGKSGVVLYLTRLAAGQTRSLRFSAVATMAGNLRAPATVAYPYYTPASQAVSPPVAFTVTP